MPIAALDSEFAFSTDSPASIPAPVAPTADPLAALVGTWRGRGFNAIWVPQNPQEGSDHFLKLTLTQETISFSRIPGTIPNRGLLQGDIEMTGLTYMDQISDDAGNGLHIEPGIWAVAPATTQPPVEQSVIRMASIPHGTTILAQGTASGPTPGPPVIGTASLAPLQNGAVFNPPFQELTLAGNPPFRTSCQTHRFAG